MRYLISLLLLTVAGIAQSSQLQGVGSFEELNKPLFVVALYSADTSLNKPGRLEFKVVDEKISVRHFRKIWQDVFSVAQSRDVWKAYGKDLDEFLKIIKGPLISNDQLVLERHGDKTVVSLNYREHAQLSDEFLDLVVSTLTGRIAPVPVLRDGLLGQLSESERRTLLHKLDSGEPTLGRISETRRWLRMRSDEDSRVTLL